MCHDALKCAVLYCVVDRVVLGIRLLAELIWILSSSCLDPWLAQSWPQSKRAGALNQLELKIRFNSEAGWIKGIESELTRNASIMDGPKRGEPRRDEMHRDEPKQYEPRGRPNLGNLGGPDT